MNIYATLHIGDINREFYEQDVTEVIEKIIDKEQSRIFGNQEIPSQAILDKVKESLITNIDKLIKFPEEFNFNLYDLDKNTDIEDAFWKELDSRLYKAFTKYHFTDMDGINIVYRKDVDLYDYYVKSWEEFLELYDNNEVIVLFKNDNMIIYMEYYKPIDITSVEFK